MNKIIYFAFVVLCFCSCQKKKWTIKNVSFEKIAIDSATNALADEEYVAELVPFKQQVYSQLEHVIGTTAVTMTVDRPESLLSNFCADVYRKKASEKLQQSVDIAIVNVGGLRTPISEGSITLRKIFELMPFENELVVLWLKGSDVTALLDTIAKIGGEGISGVRMGIKNEKAVNATINGEQLDDERVYTIATNDFLAEGNDKLTPLVLYEKRFDTGLKVRDALIDDIKERTEKGILIQSRLDERIYIVND